MLSLLFFFFPFLSCFSLFLLFYLFPFVVGVVIFLPFLGGRSPFPSWLPLSLPCWLGGPLPSPHLLVLWSSLPSPLVVWAVSRSGVGEKCLCSSPPLTSSGWAVFTSLSCLRSSAEDRCHQFTASDLNTFTNTFLINMRMKFVTTTT